MSRELEYRKYVLAYFGDVYKDPTKPVDAGAIAAALGLKKNVIDPFGNLAIPESNFRAAISNRIGAREEQVHGTKKNPDTQTRYNQVPEINLAMNAKLQEAIYKAMSPLDESGGTAGREED